MTSVDPGVKTLNVLSPLTAKEDAAAQASMTAKAARDNLIFYSP
jgi:hypothetical protein